MKTVLFWFMFGIGVWFPLCLARADEPVMVAQTNSQINSPNASIVAVPVPPGKAVRHYHATIAVGATAIIWSFLSPALFLFTRWSAGFAPGRSDKGKTGISLLFSTPLPLACSISSSICR